MGWVADTISAWVRPARAGKSHGPDSRAADGRSIAGTGLRLATRPGRPDHLSSGFAQTAWVKGLVESPGVGTTRELKGFGLLGARAVHSLRPAPCLLVSRCRGVPTRASKRDAHMYSVGRRNAYRLGKRLHDSSSRGRQGGRGTYRAADSLVLPSARSSLAARRRWKNS